jgi:hypothetical protein
MVRSRWFLLTAGAAACLSPLGDGAAGELVIDESATEVVSFVGFPGEFFFLDYHPRNTRLVLRRRDAADVLSAFAECEAIEGPGRCTILIEFLSLRGTTKLTRGVRTCPEWEALEAAAGRDADHQDSYARASCHDLFYTSRNKQWTYDRHQYRRLHRQLDEKGWDEPNPFAQSLFVDHLQTNYPTAFSSRDVALWVGPVDLQSGIIYWGEIYRESGEGMRP